MKPLPFTLAIAAIAVAPLAASVIARADNTITFDNTNFGPSSDGSSSQSSTRDAAYPYVGQQDFVLNGMIRRVDVDHDRIVVFSDSNQRFNVDDYDADIRLNDTDADTMDLRNGMRVRITGRLLGRTFLEADRLRVINDQSQNVDTEAEAPGQDQVTSSNDGFNDNATPSVSGSQGNDLISNDPAQVWPAVPSTPAISGTPVSMDAVITQVSADGRHIDLLDSADHALTADTLGSDIIVPGVNSEGQFADLVRGMHVKLIGTQAADGSIQADRIRVQPDAAPPAAQIVSQVAPAVPPMPVDVDLSQYTGVLIDASGLPGIERSPAPSLVSEDGTLIYPDRSDVPTPDEVQSESIVRYYRSLADAEQGVAGAHPLILRAIAVVGDAHDGLELSPDDTALFEALNSRLRYTHTWKVGFLIPGDR